MNAYVHTLLRYEGGTGGGEDDDAEPMLDVESVIFMIDSGTEGFKGNVRVIIPSQSSCIDCNAEMFPPEVKVPLCTIAATPRNVAHCIQWAGLLAWPAEKPFPDSPEKCDCDNPEHVQWVLKKAVARAEEFKVTKGGPLDLSKVLGVLKNIIPAIASTNALIAAVACSEAVKIVTSVAPVLNNYVFFNAEEGCYAAPQSLEKKASCEVCSHAGTLEHTVVADPSETLGALKERILSTPQYGLSSKRPPRLFVGSALIYMHLAEGKNAQLRQRYNANLETPLSQLLEDGAALTVVEDFPDDDPNQTPPMEFVVQFKRK